MKRMAFFCLVICFLLLQGGAVAQHKESPSVREQESTKWEPVKDGIWVQRLWSKDEWPQIAVLKLSADAFKEFGKDPAKLINDNHIFPAQVQHPAGPGVSLTADKEPGGVWVVTVVHGRPSRAYYSSVPEPPKKY